MTELYIDGQLAALPEGFNITFTSENPYFTRSSNYSLDIELSPCLPIMPYSST